MPSCAAFLIRNSTGSMPILLGELVDHAFHREGRHRRRRRAIGRGLRPVDQHFVADRPDVLEPVAGEGGHGAELGPHAAIGAAGIAQSRLGRGDRAVLAGADLDVDRGGAGRTRGAEHLVARHDQLDRPSGLARQRQRDRLGPDMGLAAETAADFRGGDAQLRDVHPEQLRAVLAVDEMALGADPQVGRAVGARRSPRRHAARYSPDASARS